jgi:hypothetical protein
MRVRRALAGLALTAATAGLFAAVPATAANAAGMPTYTCAQWMPAPHVYPYMVMAGDCQAADGAPQDGPMGGVTVILPRGPGETATQTWVCQVTEARSEGGQIVRVTGRNCEPQSD